MSIVDEVLGPMDPNMEPMTVEELMLCLPYSNVEVWTRLVQGQLNSGECRFRGPPGIWEKLASQYCSETGQEIISPPSIYTTLIDSTTAG